MTEVSQRAREENVSLVRFLYADHGGIIRGKAAATARLAERIESGIGHTRAMMAMSMMDELQPVEGMGPVGEVRIKPDPNTFVTLPYAFGAAAMLADQVNPDGTPWDGCARTFLKQAIADLAAEGYELQASFEPEFTLGRREGAALIARRRKPVLLCYRFPPGARLYYRPRRCAEQTRSRGRALLPRAWPRPARGTHQARDGAARRGQPRPAARDRAGRGDPAGAVGELRAETAAGPGGQRRPPARLAVGGRVERVRRSVRPVRHVQARLPLPRRGARSPARPRGADLRQREQLPAARAVRCGRARSPAGARTTGRPRVRLCSPIGAAGSVNLELKPCRLDREPLPRARRLHLRGHRRYPPVARSGRAAACRPRDIVFVGT